MSTSRTEQAPPATCTGFGFSRDLVCFRNQISQRTGELAKLPTPGVRWEQQEGPGPDKYPLASHHTSSNKNRGFHHIKSIAERNECWVHQAFLKFPSKTLCEGTCPARAPRVQALIVSLIDQRSSPLWPQEVVGFTPCPLAGS